MLHTLPPTTSCHLERKFQLSLSNAESLTIHRYHNAHHVDNLYHAMTTVDVAMVGMGFCAHLLKMYVLLSNKSFFITNSPPNDSGPKRQRQSPSTTDEGKNENNNNWGSRG